jgi:hypothetical protein
VPAHDEKASPFLSHNKLFSRLNHFLGSRYSAAMRSALLLGLFATMPLASEAFSKARPTIAWHHQRQSSASAAARRTPVTRFAEEPSSSAEETTQKWGLEAGLWKTFRSDSDMKEKGDDAKALLAKYGSAYLVTSISLALVSFGICYLLVDNGIDVASLLQNVGIDFIPEKAGTFAIAYAAHKAASPIRFPPTVALTPVVARALSRKDEAGSAE